jgi:hypothetical protein
MVYERYIKKGDKVYGPYAYHSKKQDGKVISTYIGKNNELDSDVLHNKIGSVIKKEDKRKKFPFKKFFLVTFISLALIFFFLTNLNFTGKVTIDSVYSDNGFLKGNLSLVLQQSELIPADTQVIFHSAGSEYVYNLSELVSAEPISGDFYIQNKSISGSGLGYAVDAVRFPLVSFVLGIYNEVQDSGSSRSIPVEPVNEEVPSAVPTPEVSSGQRSITGFASIFSFLPKLLGRVTLELVEEVEGEVSANQSITYILDDTYYVEVISSSQDVELDVDGNNVTVSTNYLGEINETISISLDNLNISTDEGTLSVSFVYDGEELFEDSIYIQPNETEVRTLPVEPIFT